MATTDTPAPAFWMYEFLDSSGNVRAATPYTDEITTIWSEYDGQPGMTASAGIVQVRRVRVAASELRLARVPTERNEAGAAELLAVCADLLAFAIGKAAHVHKSDQAATQALYDRAAAILAKATQS